MNDEDRELIQTKADIYDWMVFRHPGHGNQKVHGNRFGSYGAAKESLRRLKDDKGAREKYKESARGRNNSKITPQSLKKIAAKLSKESEFEYSEKDIRSKKIREVADLMDKTEKYKRDFGANGLTALSDKAIKDKLKELGL